MQGDYGQPRPALIVQTNLLDTTSTIVVLTLTSTLSDSPKVRYTVDPTSTNGLRVRSQVQIDKIFSVGRDKVGQTIGRLEDESMSAVTSLLALLLGIS